MFAQAVSRLNPASGIAAATFARRLPRLGPIYLLPQPRRDYDEDWEVVGGRRQQTWAMRMSSCAGENPYVVVVRRVQPGDLVLSCELDAERSYMKARFRTASGRQIGEAFEFGDEKPVTVEDLQATARGAAMEARCLRSANHSLKLLLPPHGEMMLGHVEIWQGRTDESA